MDHLKPHGLGKATGLMTDSSNLALKNRPHLLRRERSPSFAVIRLASTLDVNSTPQRPGHWFKN